MDEVEIRSETSQEEKTFTAHNIPTGVTTGQWFPLPLNNYGNVTGANDT